MIYIPLLLMVLSLSPLEPQAPAPSETTDTQLLSAMRENHRQAQGWFWSWSAMLVAMSATQLALAIAAPPQEKGTWALGAGLYGAGVLVHAVLAPFTPAFGPSEGASRAELEKSLAQQAWVARFTRSWAAHLIGVSSGLLMGGIAWLQMGRPLDAVFHLVTAIAVTELKIWTQPGGVIELHERVQVNLAVSSAGGSLRVQW